MKWATVFEQVAARPESLAEIARLNGITPDEILNQVESQTTCHGSNYDAARRAKDALSRRPEESDVYKKLKEEARKKLEDEAKDKLKEKAEEEIKKAWEERQKQEQAQRQQQAQQQERARQLREQAQRASQQGTRPSGQRSSTSSQGGGQGYTPPATQKKSGCSRGLKRLLGAVVAIAVLAVVWYVFKSAGPISGGTTGGGPTVAPTCPPAVVEIRKCPWAPDGYAVEPCPQGFCYDAGPQGSLSCKQEVSVEHSGRDYYSNVVCNEGYYPERDPCTNVILQCVKQ